MILKTCNVEQELERCHLCDGIVAHGDVVREIPGIDDEGVRYVALEHAECVVEDERLGVTKNLDAEERGACLADLAEVEDSMGEPVSPEYRAFRAEVDARVPALTVDVRRFALAARDLAAVVARAEAAEAKVAALDARWTALREHIATARDEQDGAAERGSCREAAAAADALDDVLRHMGEAAARGCGVA